MATSKLFVFAASAAAALALSACGAGAVVSGTAHGNFSIEGDNMTMQKGASFCFDKPLVIMTKAGAVVTVTANSELVATLPMSLNLATGYASAPSFDMNKTCTVAAPAAPTATAAISVTAVPSATAVPQPTAAPAAGPVADRPPFRAAVPITGTSLTMSLACNANDRGAMVAAESGTILLTSGVQTSTFSFGAAGDAGRRMENAVFVGCINSGSVNTLVVTIGTPGQGTVNVLDNAPTGGVARAKNDFLAMLKTSSESNCTPAPNAGCTKVQIWGTGPNAASFDMTPEGRQKAVDFTIPFFWK